MRSGIFSGLVTHIRHIPKKHEFSYRVNMYYICLDELATIAKKCKIISINKFNLLSFIFKNYIGHDKTDMINKVREKIENAGFKYNDDKIFLLTNLSYLGYCYNPVTFYYCYDRKEENLLYILAEINNTPWNERHTYVLPCTASNNNEDFVFNKSFHISPFMPMDISYKWFFKKNEKNINIVMQAFKDQQLNFIATMSLKRSEMNNKNTILSFIKHPLVVQKTIFGIYWQALILWLKRCKFYPHI